MAVEDAISEICHVIQLRLTGQVSKLMLFNCWDFALIVLVTLVHSWPTVVVKIWSMWLEIYITFFIVSYRSKYIAQIVDETYQ